MLQNYLQQVSQMGKVLVAEPDDLSSVPGAHAVEGEN